MLLILIITVVFVFYSMNRRAEITGFGAEGPETSIETSEDTEDVVMEEEKSSGSAVLSLLADQKGVSVLIEKKEYKLTVLNDGKKIKEYRVAVGKNRGDKRRVGDMRTPEGDFTVQQIQNASSWTHDFHDGKGAIKNAYGPLFIRLKTEPWKGIGIHGTHDPASIGTNATEGCIRLNNDDLLEFRKLIAVGAKVVISP
jgi:lipoprotein-anchoring transpeptidase ErfK/SrfK